MKNKTKILVAAVALMMVGLANNSFAQRVHANINFSAGGEQGYYAPQPYQNNNVGYYNNNAGYYGNVVYNNHERYEGRHGWGRGRRMMMYRENSYANRDRGCEAPRYNNYNGYNGYDRYR